MKKELVVLGIISIMAVGTITYASDKVSVPNTEQSQVYIDEADTLMRKNDVVGAEKKLNDALKLNSKNAEVYYRLGIIENTKNNNDKAYTYFTKAIEISPDNDDYYFARSYVETQAFQLQSLINDLNKVIELNPQRAQAYALLAVIYDRYGFTEKAIEYYDKAIKYDTTSFDMLYTLRAELKVKLRDYDGAIADYNKAIEITKKGKSSSNAQKIESLKEKICEIQQAKKVFK